MTLKRYIEAGLARNVEGIAGSIGVAPSTVYRWMAGEAPIPLHHALEIRKLTDGAVQPDDWTYTPAAKAAG